MSESGSSAAINVMPTAARHVVGRAADADRMGVRRLVLPDSGARTRDPWTILGAATQTTSRIRLGLITNPSTRRPEVTAAALATLDDLSGGRGFVVMSVGGRVQLRSMGVERSSSVDELVGALRVLRERHPDGEVWVATKGPRTIRAISGLVDGVLLSGVPLATVSALADRTREHCGARVALTLHHFFDDTSRVESAERLVYEITNMRAEYALAGGVDAALRAQVVEELQRSNAIEAGRLVPDQVLANFYPNTSAERADVVAAHLADLCGVDEVVLPERSFFPEGVEDAQDRMAACERN